MTILSVLEVKAPRHGAGGSDVRRIKRRVPHGEATKKAVIVIGPVRRRGRRRVNAVGADSKLGADATRQARGAEDPALEREGVTSGVVNKGGIDVGADVRAVVRVCEAVPRRRRS